MTGSRRAVGVVMGVALLGLWVWPAVSRGQAPAEKAKAVAPAAVDPKHLLIGSLASSHVYTTFGYIGVVWDNAQKNIYTSENIEDLMKEVSVLADSLTVQLEAFQKTDLTPEDAKAVQEIIEIYALLKKEADALRAYTKGKTEANGKEFQRLRGETWKRISKLLELPPKASENSR